MELDVFNFKGPGIALTMYNVDEVCLIVFSVLSMPYNMLIFPF